MPSINLSLRPLFWSMTSVILLSSSLLALAPSLESSWKQDAQTRHTVASMALLDAGIEAAWRVSAERGPSNGLLGADDAEQAAWRIRLAAQRAATDSALEHLHALLGDSAEWRTQATIVAQVMHDLSMQRAQIDRFATLPLVRREPAVMEQRVAGMIALVAPLAAINVRIGADIVRHDQSQTDNVEIALLAAELREYVGQIGSRVAVGLFRRQGLDMPHQRTIDQLNGRVDELQFLIQTRLADNATDIDFRAPQGASIARDLAADAALVDQIEAMLRASRAGNPDRLPTPGQFTDRYVPRMASIEALPDLIVGDATRRAEHSRRQATLWMLLTGTTIASLLGVIAFAGVLLNRSVIRPLVAVTAHIRTVAAKCEPIDPQRRTGGEIAELLHASEVLRQANHRRQRLERERDKLLQRLRKLANTDHLTGLLNRRVFHADGVSALKAGREIAVLLCDVDHFKQVNDRLGHTAGDQVLRLAAQRLRHAIGDAGTVYRYGGEEFAVILETGPQDHSPSRVMAERLRAAFADAPFLVDTETLKITVSIGVSRSVRGDDLSVLLDRADKALYQAKHQGRNCVRSFAARQSSEQACSA